MVINSVIAWPHTSKPLTMALQVMFAAVTRPIAPAFEPAAADALLDDIHAQRRDSALPTDARFVVETSRDDLGDTLTKRKGKGSREPGRVAAHP
jgi:hypothetical protein